MLVLLLQGALAIPPAIGGGEAHGPAVVPHAREVSWEEFCREHFDPARALPMPTAKEAGKKPRDLARSLETWLGKDLALAPDAARPAGHRPTYVGDLIREVYRLRLDRKALDRQLGARANTLPGLTQEDRLWVRELVAVGGLYQEKWSPDDGRRDDGVLHFDSWEMEDNRARSAFWRDRGGSDTVLRSAVLTFSDLQTWCEVENETELYYDFRGNNFKEVRIVEDSEVYAKLPRSEMVVQGRAFYFKSKLPWPFGSYSSTTKVRSMARGEDSWIAEVYADSKDFYWFAGRDVFLPVRDREGETVCWMVVQEFGFDLDGVPESNGNRKAGVRTTLGNKKRLTEPRYLEASSASKAATSSASSGDVRGPK